VFQLFQFANRVQSEGRAHKLRGLLGFSPKACHSVLTLSFCTEWPRSHFAVQPQHTKQGARDFLISRPAQRPIQLPVQWVPGALSPGLKRQGREANHSPPSSTEVKNGGTVPPLSHPSLWRSN
jgi:hypothetical protein